MQYTRLYKIVNVKCVNAVYSVSNTWYADRDYVISHNPTVL